MRLFLNDSLIDLDLIGVTLKNIPPIDSDSWTGITAKGEFDLGAFAYACFLEGYGEEKLVFAPNKMELCSTGTKSGRQRARALSWLRSDYNALDLIAAVA